MLNLEKRSLLIIRLHQLFFKNAKFSLFQILFFKSYKVNPNYYHHHLQIILLSLLDNFIKNQLIF